MSFEYQVKVTDTLTPLRVTFRDDDGPIDLSSAASVTLVLVNRVTRARSTLELTVDDDPETGRASLAWGESFPERGDYLAEYVLSFGETQAIVPSTGRLAFRFEAAL